MVVLAIQGDSADSAFCSPVFSMAMTGSTAYIFAHTSCLLDIPERPFTYITNESGDMESPWATPLSQMIDLLRTLKFPTKRTFEDKRWDDGDTLLEIRFSTATNSESNGLCPLREFSGDDVMVVDT